MILLASAGLQHGNTLLTPGDRWYSVMQYCQGNLIQWVAYGFRKVGSFLGSFLDTEKDGMNYPAGEGWEAQLSRFSTCKSLPQDRLAILDW